MMKFDTPWIMSYGIPATHQVIAEASEASGLVPVVMKRYGNEHRKPKNKPNSPDKADKETALSVLPKILVIR